MSASKTATAAPSATFSGASEDYVPIFRSASNVLDVGCGRGELLDLLRQQGITAGGVDSNDAMVQLCRARGLEVERGDGLEFLERQGDGSLGGLVAIQVVEHFEPRYLMRFLEAAYHKLAAGAPLVRNDQPGLLDGVLRVLHPGRHAPAGTPSRHAPVPRADERLHARGRPISLTRRRR